MRKILLFIGLLLCSVEIELPRNWDSLMAELGYGPLNEYML